MLKITKINPAKFIEQQRLNQKKDRLNILESVVIPEIERLEKETK